MAKFHVLIPAAGSGSRMDSGIPKQYLQLLGMPLLAHSFNVFVKNSRINSVNILLSSEDAHWENQEIKMHE